MTNTHRLKYEGERCNEFHQNSYSNVMMLFHSLKQHRKEQLPRGTFLSHHFFFNPGVQQQWKTQQLTGEQNARLHMINWKRVWGGIKWNLSTTILKDLSMKPRQSPEFLHHPIRRKINRALHQLQHLGYHDHSAEIQMLFFQKPHRFQLLTPGGQLQQLLSQMLGWLQSRRFLLEVEAQPGGKNGDWIEINGSDKAS